MTDTTEEHGVEANWAGTHYFQAARLHRPETVDELRRVVAGAWRVRALGSRHSFNGVADAEDGDLVSLERLAPAVEIDRERMVATVGGGATYTDIAPVLDQAGFALHNLASLPHITVVGAVATGTHGSGDKNGNLATAVRGLELVRPDGTLAQVTPDDPDWAGFPVGVGRLGPVTRVTLALQPAFSVRQHVYRDLPWDQLLAHLDEIMASGYSTSVFTRWAGPTVEQVWVKTADASSDPPPSTLFGAVSSPETHSVPALEGSNVNPRDGSPGPWWLRLPHFRPDGRPSWGDEVQTEYLVPRTEALNALRALRELGDRIEPHLLVTELRSVAGDDLWLSPMQGRDTFAIHFTWRKQLEAVFALLPEVEAALAPFSPRPHWGKVFTLDAATVRGRYPLLPQFQELSRRWDPDGKFANEFSRTYLD